MKNFKNKNTAFSLVIWINHKMFNEANYIAIKTGQIEAISDAVGSLVALFIFIISNDDWNIEAREMLYLIVNFYFQ